MTSLRFRFSPVQKQSSSLRWDLVRRMEILVLACVPAPVFGEERSGLIDLSYSGNQRSESGFAEENAGSLRAVTRKFRAFSERVYVLYSLIFNTSQRWDSNP